MTLFKWSKRSVLYKDLSFSPLLDRIDSEEKEEREERRICNKVADLVDEPVAWLPRYS